jgi:dihydrodipicolinate synthase/N-acetylneuraminate lyase
MTGLAPEELKAAVDRGLLAFPLTDFDAADALDTRASAARLEWLAAHLPAAFFMAGGAGEFFYAVSIVKAGATLVGRSAGKVRPPLSDRAPDETAELRALTVRLGPQDRSEAIRQ